jgi:hypothetical protein
MRAHLVRSIDGSSTLQSLVHSHTLPTVLYRPYALGLNAFTGAVNSHPSSAARVWWQGTEMRIRMPTKRAGGLKGMRLKQCCWLQD